MIKLKKKLTAAQKQARKIAKAERKKKYEWIFMDGKQVRIKRTPSVDSMTIDKFTQHNANPIFLHQNELWEYIQIEEYKNKEESQNFSENNTLPF